MNKGAAEYGDSSFLFDDRDLIAEMREEIADSVAYISMQIQRLLRESDEHPEVVLHLHEAAVMLCMADAHARAAKLARRE